MNFYSQAGQDRLVYELLVEPENYLHGTFLDIGCNHPVTINNTYALERIGWRGLLVDNDEYCKRLCSEQRISPFWFCDATMVAWRPVLEGQGLWPQIDYLSLDCDAAVQKILEGLPLDSLRFRVMTIEHDAYRFWNGPRDAMRKLLLSLEYVLLCADVCSNGMAFEDWWVDPSSMDMKLAGRYRCAGRDWREIFARAKAVE